VLPLPNCREQNFVNISNTVVIASISKMQSNLDSFSMSGAISRSSDASSHPARSNEPTWIADNVTEIAPDNSSLEMLATAATSYERVARDSASRLMETRARTQTGMSIASPQFYLPSRAL